MTCTHVHLAEGSCVTICGPSSWKEFRRSPAGVKWCFKCRKHLPHDWIVVGEGGLSWYEPIARYDCSGCHQEHVLFPGWAWESDL